MKTLDIKLDVQPGKKCLQALVNKYSNPVYQFDKHGVFLREFPSLKEAERYTNISASNIRAVLNNKRLTAGGFT